MHRHHRVLTLGCASLLLAGCGTAGVTYDNARTTPATDVASATELVDAAGNKAIVVNIPISRIMIETSPAHTQANNDSTRNIAFSAAISRMPKKLAQSADALSSVTVVTAEYSHAPTLPDKYLKIHEIASHGSAAPSGHPAGNGALSGGDDNSGADNAPLGTSVFTKTIVAKGFNYKVSIVPMESDDMTLRVTPVNDFFSENNLVVTKLAGTDIPIGVSNTFTDLTPTRVNDVGGVIKSVIVAAGAPGSETEPCSITPPPTATIDATTQNVGQGYYPLDPSKNECWTYSFSPDSRARQSDIVARKTFTDPAFKGTDLNVWPVPACLNGTLTIYESKPEPSNSNSGHLIPVVTISVTIIDPENVRLVGIPDKGAIKMHPVCNADVTDAPVDKWGTAFDVLSALATQAKAIKATKSQKP